MIPLWVLVRDVSADILNGVGAGTGTGSAPSVTFVVHLLCCCSWFTNYNGLDHHDVTQPSKWPQHLCCCGITQICYYILTG